MAAVRLTPPSRRPAWRSCGIVPSGSVFRTACASGPPYWKQRGSVTSITERRFCGAIAFSPRRRNSRRCEVWWRWTKRSSPRVPKVNRRLRGRRPPRKRGGLKGRRGLSHAQQPVMTATARGGETYAWRSVATRELPVTVTMQSWTTRDAVIVSDAHRSYAAATRSLEAVTRSH